jgi:hypothetical protein
MMLKSIYETFNQNVSFVFSLKLNALKMLDFLYIFYASLTVVYLTTDVVKLGILVSKHILIKQAINQSINFI